MNRLGHSKKFQLTEVRKQVRSEKYYLVDLGSNKTHGIIVIYMLHARSPRMLDERKV